MSQPANIDPQWRPALRRGVVLRYDNRRHAHLLVMPERAVVLNTTAAAILSLSNCRRSIDAVVSACRARYVQGFVADDVVEFLTEVRGQGWLV